MYHSRHLQLAGAPAALLMANSFYYLRSAAAQAGRLRGTSACDHLDQCLERDTVVVLQCAYVSKDLQGFLLHETLSDAMHDVGFASADAVLPDAFLLPATHMRI